MSTQPDALRQELQESLDKTFPYNGCPYDKVAVLILYWREDDFTPSCEQEAQKVLELFRDNFHYQTETFEIPSDNSQNQLEFKVVHFKLQHDSDSSLIIVYYSGHGDRDGDRRKSVWAAKNVGGPVLDWFLIQPVLVHAKADVLLIFDCCYASSAAKVREEAGVELLAASPSGGQTPKPGNYSFTQFFVQETMEALKNQGEVWVADLPKAILQHSEQDPVYIPLRRSTRTSILLRPISSSPVPLTSRNSFVNVSLAAFSFTVMVKEPPSKESVRQLGNWIRSSAPRSVSTVQIDRIVDLSNSLQEFMLEEGKAGVEGRLIDTLASTTRDRVLSEIRDIGEIAAIPQVTDNPSLESSHQIQKRNIVAETTQSATGLFRVWEQRVQKLSQTVWSLIASHPDYRSASMLEELEQNAVAQQAGISDAARLQLLARDLHTLSEADVKFWKPREVLDRQLKSTDKYVTGKIGDTEIIVEVIRSSLIDEEASQESRRSQLKKVISLLSSNKPDYFRVCRCLGFTSEREDGGGWYGLVFELPCRPKRLSVLKSEFKRKSRVPLEVRYQIAHAIALSLAGLHSVGWVHKSIMSDNILFLSSNGDLTNTELQEPWLFGFGSAREHAAASDNKADFRVERIVYLEPSRWGVPQEKFSYRHDTYTLGVLLLEIGLWCPVMSIDKKLPKVSRPVEAQKILIEKARDDLSHLMGTAYSTVVLSCLQGTIDHTESDIMGFQKNIVEVLECLAKLGEQTASDRDNYRE